MMAMVTGTQWPKNIWRSTLVSVSHFMIIWWQNWVHPNISKENDVSICIYILPSIYIYNNLHS